MNNEIERYPGELKELREQVERKDKVIEAARNLTLAQGQSIDVWWDNLELAIAEHDKEPHNRREP